MKAVGPSLPPALPERYNVTERRELAVCTSCFFFALSPMILTSPPLACRPVSSPPKTKCSMSSLRSVWQGRGLKVAHGATQTARRVPAGYVRAHRGAPRTTASGAMVLEGAGLGGVGQVAGGVPEGAATVGQAGVLLAQKLEGRFDILPQGTNVKDCGAGAEAQGQGAGLTSCHRYCCSTVIAVLLVVLA
jgi:hypothetical protein